MLSFSVAVDEKCGIGIRGGLPWHLKGELKIFKANTMGKHIIMGQTTYDNLPNKLPGRKIVVISIDPNYVAEDCEVSHDLIAFLKEHENDEEEYVVCGGASIFRQAYPYCKKAYVSFVKGEYEVDTYFDALDLDEWNIIQEVDYPEFTYRELIRK